MAKQGDHSAYLELCRRASPQAMGMVLRITKNQHDAEDVMQEAMLNAFVHLRDFSGQSAFSTWFTRIAVNSALMLLRKQRRVTHISRYGVDGEDIFDTLADPSPNPETVLSQRENKTLLRGAIQQLPSTLRRTVELRLAESGTLHEIAAYMGISLPAAKSRLARATVRLHATIEQSTSGGRQDFLNA